MATSCLISPQISDAPIGSQTKVTIGGTDVEIKLETDYPWDGRVKVRVNPKQNTQFTLSLRVPGWAKGQPVPSDLYRYLDATPEAITIVINGEEASANDDGGHINIDREWRSGDTIDLHLPMPIRRVISHQNIEDNVGKVALERGPIVYAAEGIDNGGKALDIVLPDDKTLVAEHRPDLLNGVTVITSEGFMAIPYYAWAHRGLSEMSIWYKRKG